MSSFDAFAALELGRDPRVPLGALLFMVSMMLALEGFALAEALGLWFLAPLLPMLMFANNIFGQGELTRDVRRNVAENWGRLAILAAIILAVHALDPSLSRKDLVAPGAHDPGGSIADSDDPQGRDAPDPGGSQGRWAAPVLGGVMVGVSAGTHLVPTAVGLGLFVAYALLRVIVDLKLSEVLRAGTITLIVGALLGGAVLLIPGGDLGFGGAAGGSPTTPSDRNLGCRTPSTPPSSSSVETSRRQSNRSSMDPPMRCETSPGSSRSSRRRPFNQARASCCR